MIGSKTYGLTHLAIAVSNEERTIKFYQSVFNMQVMYNKMSLFNYPHRDVMIFLVFEEKQETSIGQTSGIAHFGFRLKNPNDIDEIAAIKLSN